MSFLVRPLNQKSAHHINARLSCGLAIAIQNAKSVFFQFEANLCGHLSCLLSLFAYQAGKAKSRATQLVARTTNSLHIRWFAVIPMVVILRLTSTVSATHRVWFWQLALSNSCRNCCMCFCSASSLSPCKMTGKALLCNSMSLGDITTTMLAKPAHIDASAGCAALKTDHSISGLSSSHRTPVSRSIRGQYSAGTLVMRQPLTAWTLGASITWVNAVKPPAAVIAWLSASFMPCIVASFSS